MDIQKMRACSQLLPAPGDEVVRECLDEIARLRFHLTELGKFADRAGLVLATLDPEDATEGEMLQEIIDGISTWAAPAILGEAKGPNKEVRGAEQASPAERPS